jgi:hypothetical protein
MENDSIRAVRCLAISKKPTHGAALPTFVAGVSIGDTPGSPVPRDTPVFAHLTFPQPVEISVKCVFSASSNTGTLQEILISSSVIFPFVLRPSHHEVDHVPHRASLFEIRAQLQLFVVTRAILDRPLVGEDSVVQDERNGLERHDPPLDGAFVDVSSSHLREHVVPSRDFQEVVVNLWRVVRPFQIFKRLSA